MLDDNEAFDIINYLERLLRNLNNHEGLESI
jgi:hypothetical protein